MFIDLPLYLLFLGRLDDFPRARIDHSPHRVLLPDLLDLVRERLYLVA